MRFFVLVGLASLLAGCDSQPTTTTTQARPAELAPPAAQPATARLQAPDTTDYASPHYDFPTYRAEQDTFITLGRQHKWLHIALAPDSTKPLDYAPAAIVGQPFAAPTDSAWQAHRVRGYEGAFTFTRLGAAHAALS